MEKCSTCGKEKPRSSPSCSYCLRDRCRSCGLRTQAAGSTLCQACSEKAKLRDVLPTATGWRRGGGPVATRWKVFDDLNQAMELDPMSSSDEEDDWQYEELDTSIAPEKGVKGKEQLLLNENSAVVKDILKNAGETPITLGSAAKAMTKELRNAANLRFSKLKDDRGIKVQKAMLDALSKADDYAQETSTLLEELRVMIEGSKMDDNKVKNTATKLRERCAAPAYLGYLDKLIAEQQTEHDLKLGELRALEGTAVAATPSKGQLEKKMKENEEYDKVKSRLGNELKQVQAALTKLETQWQAEESRATKEIASLRTQIEGGKGVIAEKNELEVEALRLGDQVKELEKQLAKCVQDESKKKLQVEKAEKAARAAAAPPQGPLVPITEESAVIALAELDAGIDEEECPYCMNPLHHLIMLFPCGHDMCEDCFANAIKDSKKRHTKFMFTTCPACKVPVDAWRTTRGAAGKIDNGQVLVTSGSLA